MNHDVRDENEDHRESFLIRRSSSIVCVAVVARTEI